MNKLNIFVQLLIALYVSTELSLSLEGGTLDYHPHQWHLPAFGEEYDTFQFKRMRKPLGNVIALDGAHLIMHTETAEIIKQMQYPYRREFMAVPTPFEYPRLFGPPVLASVHILETVRVFNKYGLYYMQYRWPAREMWDYKIKGAPLERDIDYLGCDCYAYGWTNTWNSNSTTTLTNYSYKHMKMPVTVRQYKDKSLYVEAEDDGAFCEPDRDRGTPILCGPEQKLTYLATSSSNKKRCVKYADIESIAKIAKVISTIRGYKVLLGKLLS